MDDTPFQAVMGKVIDCAAANSGKIVGDSLPATILNEIANYGAALLNERPSPDGSHGHLNRLVIKCLFEPQIEHAFGMDIKRSGEIDANDLEAATEQATTEKPVLKALRDFVRDLTGGKANVISMERYCL